MNWCMGNTKQNHVIDRLVVPTIWPMKVETNLMQDEMIFVEEVRFVLNKQLHVFPLSLFGGASFVLLSCPLGDVAWPTTQNDKTIKWKMPFKMFKPQYTQWEASWFLKVVVNPLLKVLAHGYGQIYMIIFYAIPNWKQYEITIGNFPTCICLYFVLMLSCSWIQW